MSYDDRAGNSFDAIKVTARNPTKANDHNKSRTTLKLLRNIKALFVPGAANVAIGEHDPAVEGEPEGGAVFDFWGSFEVDDSQTIVDLSTYEDATHGWLTGTSGADKRFVSLQIWGAMCDAGDAWGDHTVYPGGGLEYEIAGGSATMGLRGETAFLCSKAEQTNHNGAVTMTSGDGRNATLEFYSNDTGDIVCELTGLAGGGGDKLWIYVRATIGPLFTDGT